MIYKPEIIPFEEITAKGVPFVEIFVSSLDEIDTVVYVLGQKIPDRAKLPYGDERILTEHLLRIYLQVYVKGTSPPRISYAQMDNMKKKAKKMVREFQKRHRTWQDTWEELFGRWKTYLREKRGITDEEANLNKAIPIPACFVYDLADELLDSMYFANYTYDIERFMIFFGNKKISAEIGGYLSYSVSGNTILRPRLYEIREIMSTGLLGLPALERLFNYAPDMFLQRLDLLSDLIPFDYQAYPLDAILYVLGGKVIVGYSLVGVPIGTTRGDPFHADELRRRIKNNIYKPERTYFVAKPQYRRNRKIS